MKDYVAKHFPADLTYDKLRAAIYEAWNAVGADELQALVRSMNARCQAVIDAMACIFHIR